MLCVEFFSGRFGYYHHRVPVTQREKKRDIYAAQHWGAVFNGVAQ